jgi:hypothetical protein
MTSTTLPRLLPLLLLAGLSGCASTSQLDRQFGIAVNTNKMLQVLHPSPQYVNPSVAGIDGKAGKSALDNYHKSFQEPVQQAGALTIGVGR